jgi:mutator protein MutT
MNQVGIFAIIFNEKEEVLLCHRRDYDLWNLPGGKLENGEAPWEGVIREVQEETNLKVKVDKLLGVYYKPEQNEVVFNFLCSVISGEVRLSEEADAIKFFAIPKLPKNTAIKQKERIFDALKGGQQPLLKKQVGATSIETIKNTHSKNKSGLKA